MLIIYIAYQTQLNSQPITSILPSPTPKVNILFPNYHPQYNNQTYIILIIKTPIHIQTYNTQPIIKPPQIAFFVFFANFVVFLRRFVEFITHITHQYTDTINEFVYFVKSEQNRDTHRRLNRIFPFGYGLFPFCFHNDSANRICIQGATRLWRVKITFLKKEFF